MGDEVNAIVASNIAESGFDAVPNDKVDWALGVTIGLDAVERVGVKRRLELVQESCRTKPRKVSNTVAGAVELANELVHHVCESSIQFEDTAQLERCLW